MIGIFIKIKDIVVANKLLAIGFSYMKEIVDGEEFYVFDAAPKLSDLLITQYGDVPLMYDDILHF